MQQETSSFIWQIRSASRDLVRQFGFLHKTVAGTDLSASAVHAIIEIGNAKALSSKNLSELLLLEKSTISRLVKSLLARREICEERSKDDGRMKYLHLTPKGHETLGAINDFAHAQVSRALIHLDDSSKRGILKGLQDYSTCLKATSRAMPERCPPPLVRANLDPIEIVEGYRPTIIGRVTDMITSYMHRHMGFGPAFEARVASDLVEFLSRIDAPQNQIWSAHLGDNIVGSIAIDGQDLGDGLAHLRWFVVVDELHGSGVGSALVERALAFCDYCEFRQTHLWTVQGLDAARKLYEKQGFTLAQEYQGDQWGNKVVEQKFVRPLADE